MPKQSEFVEYLLEMMNLFGGVTVKPMFGGHGFFKEGLMFALVTDDTLYFKTDDFSRFEFEHLKLEPFVFIRAKKPVSTSYYKAPADALDNNEEMARWCRIAFEAAVRSKKK
jgi:DNA transformation protein